jgi:hypothetical protein
VFYAGGRSVFNFVVLAGQMRHNLLASDQEGDRDGLVFDSRGFPAKCGGMAKIASVIQSKTPVTDA